MIKKMVNIFIAVAVILGCFGLYACAATKKPPVNPSNNPKVKGVKTSEAIKSVNTNDIGEGSLVINDKGKPIVCPLEHTDVTADISGYIGKVTVVQRFKNELDHPIEAEYIFPLPEMAAVDSMVMQIGDKTIRSVIKEREEATKIYEKAKKEGKRAALLNQERPNIFTQHVANIMPGDKIEIKITYVENIKFEDGIYEFVFPMVSGPRYMPKPELSDEPMTTKEKTALNSEQKETGWEVDPARVPEPKLNPPIIPEGMRAGHDISLKVNINSPVAIKDVKSRLHKVNTTKKDDKTYTIELDSSDNIPNRDFILNYTSASKKVEEGIICHTDSKKGGFFSLVIQPPAKPSTSIITPKEMIFVVDDSGSQSGRPIEKCKETMKYCIEKMNPDDTFNVISFSNTTIKLFDFPQKNNERTRKKAIDFINARTGRGGTEMKPAIIESLTGSDPERLRIVTMMTDGYFGNDMEISQLVSENIGNARMFVFGNGNGVNRYLITKMAKLGRGECDIVDLNKDSEEVANNFYKKIGCPLMTDVKADWGTLPVSEVLPEGQPDLFSEKPLIFSGRYTKGATGVLTLTGNSAGRPFTKKIEVKFPDKEEGNEAIMSFWARKKIEAVMDTDLKGIEKGNPRDDVKKEIIKLGLDYNLVTQYTSFVAVEDKVVNKSGKSEKIETPTEMPDGVSYEGIFGKKKQLDTYDSGSVNSVQSFAPTRSSRARGGGFFNGGARKMTSAPMTNTAVYVEDTEEQVKVAPQVSVPAQRNVDGRKVDVRTKETDVVVEKDASLDEALTGLRETMRKSGWKPAKTDKYVPKSIVDKYCPSNLKSKVENIKFADGALTVKIKTTDKKELENILKDYGIKNFKIENDYIIVTTEPSVIFELISETIVKEISIL